MGGNVTSGRPSRGAGSGGVVTAGGSGAA
jgi:hypothetical protein